MTSKSPEKPTRRLENIRPWEVSIVDEGANGEQFFLLKGRDRMALDETVDLAQQDTDGRVFTTVCKSEHVEQAMPKEDEEECKAEAGEPKSSASVSSAALMSAAEKLMSLAKMVREKTDGWPSNFASVIESVVSMLQSAQNDKSQEAKPEEEASEKASQSDAASTLTSVAERLLSYGKALEEGTVSDMPQAIAGLVKELSSLLAAGGKYPSPVAKEEPVTEVSQKADPYEEEEEPSEKRGRKISGARLTKLEKMESQLASLHQELKGLMTEVVEEEKKDEKVSKQADVQYEEVVSMVEKRLGKLEEMVEKMSLRRAEPKGLDIDHTSKVEKRDESSFAGILGLKF